MESDKSKGKRGRPKKLVTKIEVSDGIKRKRGRPSKSIPGENNIKIKKESVPKEIVIEEVYVPPKILRRKRVFIFDKRVFHEFANKYNGDVIIMGYVFDKLMRMYIDDKMDIPLIDIKYYYEWCRGNPPIEPLEEKELASSQAIVRGIPLRYRYPMLIDKDLYTEFERKCKTYYSQFVANELVKMMLNDKNKINIDTSKYREWCTI
jgi:hypothetical protein